MAGMTDGAAPPGPANSLMGGGGATGVNPSEAMQRLMSTPMTSDQQRAYIQQYAPHALQDFDRMQSMFRQMFPPQQGQADEPTVLGYDLEPPEDAPRPLAIQAMKLRKMLMSPPPRGDQRMPMNQPGKPMNALAMSGPMPGPQAFRNPLMMS